MNEYRHDPPPAVNDITRQAHAEESAAPRRPWWRKKRHMAWYVPLALVVAIAALSGPPQEPVAEPAVAQAPEEPKPEPEPVDEDPPAADESFADWAEAHDPDDEDDCDAVEGLIEDAAARAAGDGSDAGALIDYHRASVDRMDEVCEDRQPDPEPEPVIEDEPEPEPEPEPVETVAQENARAKAADYLDYTAFSRSGLIEQLEYEGFSASDAEYAVDNVDVNWRDQAVMKAEDYLSYTSFSRAGLIEQLEYEGFTTRQATHAVDEVGL